MLVWNHRVLNPMEDGRWALDLGHSFKIIEPLFDEQIHDSSILLPGDIFDRLDWAYQHQACRLESASEVACWTRANGPATDKDVAFTYSTSVSEESVDCVGILENLLSPLLSFASSKQCRIIILINTITRVFHANDVQLQFLDDLLHQGLSE